MRRSFVLLLISVLTSSTWVELAGAQPRGTNEEPPPDEPVKPEYPERQPIPIARNVERIDPPTQHQKPTPEAMVAGLSLELGGHGAYVDLDGAKTGIGGGAGGRLYLMGYSGAVSYRVYVNGALGGQTTGFLTRFAGDASIGPALTLSSGARLFARIGIEAAGHKDDELDASVFTIPSAYLGAQLSSEKVLFEIGPRAGTTLRAVYSPGNETEGRRHTRRSRFAPSWGGTMALVAPFLLVESSLTRVQESRGLWLGEASACPLLLSDREEGFVFCAEAQYWRGVVASPSGDTADVGSWVFGATIGYGLYNSRRRGETSAP